VTSIFLNVVLPIFLVAGLGSLFQRALRPQTSALNQLALYVLMPCLVFTSLLNINFDGPELLQIGTFSLLLTCSMLLVAAVLARFLRLDRVMVHAFMLTVAFPNLGNYGLSVALLAYGDAGLAVAVVMFAVQTVYGSTLAMFLASSSSASLSQSIRQVFRLPVIYAVIAALVVKLSGITLPTFISSAIALPSKAAIPVMLLVLGMHIASTRRIEQPAIVGVAVVTRLIVGVLLGVVLTQLLGVQGVTREILVVGSAMPTAVFTIVMSTQFDARPRFVGDVVLASTLASIVTLTIVLSILSSSVSSP
jgi:predicted permease